MVARDSDAAWKLILRAFAKHPLLALRAASMMVQAKRVNPQLYPTYVEVGHRLRWAIARALNGIEDASGKIRKVKPEEYPLVARAYTELYGPKLRLVK